MANSRLQETKQEEKQTASTSGSVAINMHDDESNETAEEAGSSPIPGLSTVKNMALAAWYSPGVRAGLADAFMSVSLSYAGYKVASIVGEKMGSICAERAAEQLAGLDQFFASPAPIDAVINLIDKQTGLPVQYSFPSNLTLGEVLAPFGIPQITTALGEGIADGAGELCNAGGQAIVGLLTLNAISLGLSTSAAYYLNAKLKKQHKELKKEFQETTNTHGGIPSMSSRDNSPLLTENNPNNHRRTRSALR